MPPFKLHNNHKTRASGRIEVSPGWHAKKKTIADKEHLIFKSDLGEVRHLFHYAQPAIVAGETVRVVKFDGKKHYVHPATGILTKLPSGGGKKRKRKKYDGQGKLRQRNYKVDVPGDKFEVRREKPEIVSTSERGLKLTER